MIAADFRVFGAHFRPYYLLTLALLLSTGKALALGVSIDAASTQNNKGVYQLNADIRYELSEEVLEALNNGVAITMQLTINIKRPRAYLWDKSIATLLQRYALKYHALSGQYIVQFLSSGKQRSYLSLASALRALGRVRELPILNQTVIQVPPNAVVHLRSELDTNALPAPLRPVAWLSREWKLRSEWFTCPLKS